MSVYSFKIKKGRFQLSLTTSDKEFVDNEFAKWVRNSAEYVQKHKVKQCKENIKTQIEAEQEITEQKINEQIDKMPKTKAIENITKQSTNKNLDIFYAPQNNSTTNTNIVSQKSENIDDILQPKTVNSVNKNTFDNLLEKSMQAPQTELQFKPSPSIKKDNAFINFINTKHTDKKIDFLLMTAYYFTQYEQRPRFTLKQLNAKLMQNIAIIIDHSVLQEAINRDYIECLPDLTGLIGSTEYRLTSYGEKVLLDD